MSFFAVAHTLPGPPLLGSLAPSSHAHAIGTVLPRGFFLGLGLLYLATLAVDRLAERLRLPAAAAILLLGLLLHDALNGWHHINPSQVETAERVSLALLIFYAGLGTDLRRIRGTMAAGLLLGSVGVLLSLLITALVLQGVAAPLADGLRLGGGGGLPLAAAWLAASCLTSIDSAALEDLLGSLGRAIPLRFSRLLQFEAALSTLVSLLVFGFIAGMLQASGNDQHLHMHAALARALPEQLWMVIRHMLAGLAAGVAVGALAPPVIDRLVRLESHLLLVAIALAFLAYGLGQLLGGGGLVAVFTAGTWLSNGNHRITRFDLHALHRGLHPFNTAAEFTVLLLLGLTVSPADLIKVLPLGLLLAVVLLLARWVGVGVSLAGSGTAFGWRDRLVLVGCGLRGAVPLGLAMAMVEEMPHLRDVPAAAAEPLAAHLLALIFLVVLLNLILQSTLMHALIGRLSPQAPAASSD